MVSAAELAALCLPSPPSARLMNLICSDRTGSPPAGADLQKVCTFQANDPSGDASTSACGFPNNFHFHQSDLSTLPALTARLPALLLATATF